MPCVFLHRVVFPDSRAESVSELWLSALSGVNRAGVDARCTADAEYASTYIDARALASFLRLLALLQPLAERSVRMRARDGPSSECYAILLPLRMIGCGRGADICPLVNE